MALHNYIMKHAVRDKTFEETMDEQIGEDNTTEDQEEEFQTSTSSTSRVMDNLRDEIASSLIGMMNE